MSIDARRKTRGRPAVDSEELRARMLRHVIAALDDWRGCQSKKLSRPDAIRQIVIERLTLEGYLPRFKATEPPE